MESIISVPLSITTDQFWGSIQIFVEKCHILNRRLCGAVNLWCAMSCEFYDAEKLYKDVQNVFVSKETFMQDVMMQSQIDDSASCMEVDLGMQNLETVPLPDVSISDHENRTLSSLKEVFMVFGFANLDQHYDITDQQHEGNHCKKGENKSVGGIPWQEFITGETRPSSVVLIRRLMPKQILKFNALMEVVILDNEKTSVFFFSESAVGALRSTPRVDYGFRINGSLFEMFLISDRSKSLHPNVTWLKTSVFPKLVKWAMEIDENSVATNRGSLRLIDVQKYNLIYQQLKVKYGQPIVKLWLEKTDPLKFVYEDVAIAAYLLLLWQEERKSLGLEQLQSFVDLGCGNGLLVHILSGEGHRGLGVDVRRRKIWSLFPGHVNLQECTIEPSNHHLYPGYDWLIGNHSDELTPWIPVIAAKSGTTTRFFIIPCCAHDFIGKYRRQRPAISQYADYVQYASQIGRECGFQVLEDRMRIPSTKRICLVGFRTQDEVHQTNIDAFIKLRCDDIIKSTSIKHCLAVPSPSEIKPWVSSFKARDPVQAVKNCTSLNASVKMDLLKTIAGQLLQHESYKEITVGDNKLQWNIGGSVTIGQLALNLGAQKLSQLKSECGGLQTLLRNHKHIFVIANGLVQLQMPTVRRSTPQLDLVRKTKACWFHLHHPQGCPLISADCCFAHD